MHSDTTELCTGYFTCRLQFMWEYEDHSVLALHLNLLVIFCVYTSVLTRLVSPMVPYLFYCTFSNEVPLQLVIVYNQ